MIVTCIFQSIEAIMKDAAVFPLSIIESELQGGMCLIYIGTEGTYWFGFLYESFPAESDLLELGLKLVSL